MGAQRGLRDPRERGCMGLHRQKWKCVGGSAAAGAQRACSEGAEVRMASSAGTGVEGVVSEARSCST